jgi:hypothetical protein
MISKRESLFFKELRLYWTYIGIDQNGVYKVGRTTDLTRRLVHLERQHDGFKMLYFCCKDVERYLHLKLSSHRVRRGTEREWFAISESQLLEIVQRNGFQKFSVGAYEATLDLVVGDMEVWKEDLRTKLQERIRYYFQQSPV